MNEAGFHLRDGPGYDLAERARRSKIEPCEFTPRNALLVQRRCYGAFPLCAHRLGPVRGLENRPKAHDPRVPEKKRRPAAV